MDTTPPGAVTVTILPTGQNVYRASVLFPTLTDREQASAALNTLAQRSGWQVGGVEWTDTPQTGTFPAHYEIRNPNLERLNVAPPMEPGQANQPEARPRPLVHWALIALLGAALAWVLVYALLGGMKRSRRSGRSHTTG